MIPRFPHFKRLSIRDQKEIDALIHTYAPYSDFNFTSLLSWDYAKKTHVSLLHDNLVIRLNDYITQEPLITLIGKAQIAQSCTEIFDYTRAHTIPSQLTLVPAVTVQALKKEKHLNTLHIKQTQDNGTFDYIYKIKDILTLSGPKYHAKRKSIRRFQEAHVDHTHLSLLDGTSPETQQALLHIFHGWQTIKNQSRIHIRNEYTAFKRLLHYSKNLPIQIIGMYMHDKLSGFIVCETLPGKHCVMHFGKVNTQATGAFEYLIHKSAELLHAQGCEYLNLQQDLNIENLRKTKLSWRPVKFLKKYTLTLNVAEKIV